MVLFLYGTIKYIIMVIINRYLYIYLMRIDIYYGCVCMWKYLFYRLKKICVYIHIDGLNM